MALRVPDVNKSLMPYWISLALLWAGGIATAVIYPWPAAVAGAFLLEGGMFLALGFPAVVERLKQQWTQRQLAFLLCVSAVLPYCAYSLPNGVFEWRSLAALAGLAAGAGLGWLGAGEASAIAAAGLLVAAVQGRQVDAIRVGLEYAQSAAAGKEIKEPPVADAEDFASHLRDEGRRKSLRKARKRRKPDSSDLQVLRQHSVLRGYLN